MLKRLFSSLTAAVMTFTAVITLFPASVFAEDETIRGETSDGFTYEITSEYAAITGWTGDKDTVTELVCPDTVEGRTVTRVTSYVFSGYPELTSVTLPSGLEYMNRNVFNNSPNLKTLTIPNTVTIDGTPAPYSIMDGVCGPLSASYIETVILEDGIEFVPHGLCYGMQYLKEIVIPDSVTQIGESAFYRCVALESVDIPDGVTEIGAGAFREAESLAEVKMPEAVETIGNSAFRKTAIDSIYLAEGLTKLGTYVFAESPNLKEVTIPSTLTEGIYSLQDSFIETVTIADGMTKIPDGLCRNTDYVSTINIPDSVTDLGYGLFMDAQGITEFTVPKQLEKSDAAFYGSTLETVHFEEGLTTLPESMFSQAKMLKNIDWCSTFTTIPSRAFQGCEGLETLVIPETVTHIGYQAFSDCISLSSLTFPETPLEMEGYIFWNTKALKSVYIPAGLYGENYHDTFYYSGLESITFAPEITEIPQFICSHCENLAEINWPDAPEVIGKCAFEYCSALTDIGLPDSIRIINDNAFYATGIETLHIPDSLEQLYSSVFAETKNLKYLYMPHELEAGKIGNYNFRDSGVEVLEYADGIETIRKTCSYMTNVQKIIIPESVTSIEAGAFDNDVSLPEITFPSGLTYIGASAFYNCLNLSSVTIPKSVTSVGWGPFSNSGLTDIYFEDGTETVPKYMCYNCTYLETAHIPESVTALGEYVFSGCRNLRTLDMVQDSVGFAHNTFNYCDSLFDERVDIYSKADTFVNRIETAVGENGLINYTVYYKINPRFEDIALDGYITVNTERSNPIDTASLPTGLRKDEESAYQYSVNYTFDGSESEGVFRFSTRPSENADTSVNAQFYLRFDTDIAEGFTRYDYQKSIPVDNDAVTGLSLTAPRYASVADGTAQFSVYGYAPADSTVAIFVNGEESVTVAPNKYSGRYSAQISCEAADGDTLSVYAKSGDSKTGTKTVSCQEDSIEVEKVILRHNNNHSEYGIDITRAFTEGITPYIAYNPSRPLAFEVTLSDNDCSAVFISSTVNGETSYIELFFDEESGTWQGEGFFETRVPGTFNIHAFSNKNMVTLAAKSDDEGNTALYSQDSIVDTSADETNQELIGKILETSEQTVEFASDDQVMVSYDFTPDAETGDKEGILHYVGVSDVTMIDGAEVTAAEISAYPEKYGFERSPVKFTDEDGNVHTYCVKLLFGYDETKELLDYITIPEAQQSAQYLPGYQQTLRSSGEKTLSQKFFDKLAEWGKSEDDIAKCTNGQIIMETVMAESGMEYNSILVNVTTEQTKNAASTILEGLAEKSAANGANKALGSIMTYAEIGSQGLGLMTDLKDTAESDAAFVREHENEMAAAFTGITMLRATNTLISGAAIGGTILAVATGGTSILVGGLITGTLVGLSIITSKCLDYIRGRGRRLLTGNTIGSEGRLQYLIDPSGIAYEFLPSNPVEGATAEIYYKDEDGNAVLWNAEDFDQVNPQITDSAGWFAWDVPEGMWQVWLSAEGYEDAASEWLPVLPVQTDVNINMYSTLPAEIKDAAYSTRKAAVTFTRHILDDSVTADSLYLTNAAGETIPCTITPVKEEGNDTNASMTFILTPTVKTDLSGAYVNVTEGVLSYAGTPSAAASAELREQPDDDDSDDDDNDDGLTLGDVNGDSSIDSSDAAMILQHYALFQSDGKGSFNAAQLAAADYNGDGSVDSSDSAMILKTYAENQSR